MKEHPILFNANSVRAILDERKTQTRRVIKPQPGMRPGNDYVDGVWYQQDKYGDSYPIKCPYGEPGDYLWVRETMSLLIEEDTGDIPLVYVADEEEVGTGTPDEIESLLDYNGHWGYGIYGRYRTIPSIHMPRWASRITLEVTGVQAERAQEICPSDCEEEGITGATPSSPVRGQPYSEYYNGDGLVYSTPRAAFAALWDSINAKPRPIKEMDKIIAYKSFPWDAKSCDQRKMINGKPHYCYPNPWVWVISFKKID